MFDPEMTSTHLRHSTDALSHKAADDIDCLLAIVSQYENITAEYRERIHSMQTRFEQLCESHKIGHVRI